MVKRILENAGVPYRRGRFPYPPVGSYAVYTDDQRRDGPDGLPWIVHHSITVALYVADLDGPDEDSMERALDQAGRHYEKDGAAWDDRSHRFQINYYFEYYEKRRPTA